VVGLWSDVDARRQAQASGKRVAPRRARFARRRLARAHLGPL